MEKEGWVTHTQEQEGNRPQRRVYSVTAEGEAAFYRLLRENIASQPSPEFPSLVGLDFLYLLPAQESIALLGNRLEFVKEKYQQLDDIEIGIRQSHLAAEYLHRYYANEIEWLTEIIKRLQSA
jgi:DNA-binding PadR family transcriptional regulator